MPLARFDIEPGKVAKNRYFCSTASHFVLPCALSLKFNTQGFEIMKNLKNAFSNFLHERTLDFGKPDVTDIGFSDFFSIVCFDWPTVVIQAQKSKK